MINKEKTNIKLAELQQRLTNRANGEITKGKKPTAESVGCAVEKIMKTEYMADIFNCNVFEQDGHIRLEFEYSEEQFERIRCDYLGKTVLFTNRKDFTNEQIVTAYRSAWTVESAFKQMKDNDHLTVKPIFHWTDEKISVHIFICVMAYRLCCLLVKELFEKGINISINRLIDEMAGIKRIHTFFDDAKKPKKVESFAKGGELAAKIERMYNLVSKYS